MVDQTAEQAGHETRDINVRVVLWFAVGMIVLAIIMHLALGGLFVFFKDRHPSPQAPSRIALHPEMLAPPPRLQTVPGAELARFQQAEKKKLNSYGWMDRQHGIVRIPIERAMELVAHRGLPTRGPGSQDSSGKTPEQMRQEKAAAQQ
jgi:hypothetical protein